MRGRVQAGAGLALLAALGGCAPLNSVYWAVDGPGESRVYSTDAFQRHLVGFQALMVGPAKLLTAACSQISGIDDRKQFSIVIGTTAGAVADPPIASSS